MDTIINFFKSYVGSECMMHSLSCALIFIYMGFFICWYNGGKKSRFHLVPFLIGAILLAGEVCLWLFNSPKCDYCFYTMLVGGGIYLFNLAMLIGGSITTRRIRKTLNKQRN